MQAVYCVPDAEAGAWCRPIEAASNRRDSRERPAPNTRARHRRRSDARRRHSKATTDRPGSRRGRARRVQQPHVKGRPDGVPGHGGGGH